MSKNNNNAFQMIADIEGDFKDLIGNQSPETAPILPVRNIVLFPGVVMPILIGRESSKALVQKAERRGTVICVIPQKASSTKFSWSNCLNSKWKLSSLLLYKVEV